MDEMVALRQHLDAQAQQVVLELADRLLVAGDDARREDAGIAGFQRDLRVGPVGDRDEAQRLAARLAAAGQPGKIVDLP